MDALTETQLTTLRSLFAIFAAGGRLGVDELRTLMAGLGLTLTTPQLKDLSARVDVGGLGSLDCPEFCQLMTAALPDVDADAEAAAVFAAFDRDADGVLSAEDLAAVLADADAGGGPAAAAGGSAGAHAAPLTAADLAVVVDEAEGPGARGVSRAKFAALLRAQLAR